MTMRPIALGAFRMAAILALCSMLTCSGQSATELYRQFVTPPEDARIMMRWWWFGPAVTKAELEREMRAMKQGGIGGFEIQPVYPLTLDDPQRGLKNLPFLSPEFIEVLQFAGAKGRELGLRVDLTLGSGWPYGGPNIPITQAAGRLRCDRVPVSPGIREVPLPKIGEGERFLAAFLVRGADRHFAPEGIIQLGEPHNGRITLPGPAGSDQMALVFISSRTRMMVKRPAVGAEGYVLDHYDRAALENHLKNVGDRLMQAFPKQKPYAVFCDSLEVFGSDWTSDFLEEFRKRRGYDLTPHLPALTGDVGAATGAFRNDWAQTLAELAGERFLSPLRAWAHRNGARLRSQTYGTPPVPLAANALVDLPEGEGSHWKRFTPSRWASSACHLLGIPITSSETWTWLHSPAFRATPLDMKAEADRHFLEGINQLIGHGWPYSPPQAGKPGWAFYAAAVFNDSNPWWIVMPDVTAYLQRVSYLLRVGKPANPVALYVPTADARARFTLGRVSIDRTLPELPVGQIIPKLLEAGYNFDLFDDELTPHALQRPIIVLPAVERIPAATYRKLEEYVRQGGKLVAAGRTPALSPGWRNAAAETREVQEISKRLFEGAKPPARLVQDWERDLGAALMEIHPPDMKLTPATGDIGYIRRDAGETQIYFIANTSNQHRHVTAQFRHERMTAEWWDPFHGSAEWIGPLSSLDLELQPYESRVLVFSRAPISKPTPRRALQKPVSIDLSSGWKVTFPDLSLTLYQEQLRSWTETQATRFFSGVAVYEKTVEVPAGGLAGEARWILDFGTGTPIPEREQKQPGMMAAYEPPVREAAVVYVNGEKVGSVWRAPFAVDVTKAIRAGVNTLRIEVANTAINEMAGRPPADYTELNRRFGVRFVPQDMDHLEPAPSGLLGKIRLFTK